MTVPGDLWPLVPGRRTSVLRRDLANDCFWDVPLVANCREGIGQSGVTDRLACFGPMRTFDGMIEAKAGCRTTPGVLRIDEEDKVRVTQDLDNPFAQHLIDEGHRAVQRYIRRLEQFGVDWEQPSGNNP
ncbi:MAG: hypothetical protein GC206_08330 [Alphaproteobacteria bacterium]|nr:hypothetical protein [Alphaproteobacteria bacterium]